MENTTEEVLHRTLNHYALISFKDAYWSLSSKEHEEFHKKWLSGLCAAARKVDIFQATESGIDLIVWSALPADDKRDAAVFFEKFVLANKPYLIIYPFSKTTEWYLMSREARQGMMNEHIRIGKQYDDIRQLLLYSFGLQNQEFVVVYETDELARFSDLVNELRDTEGRRYTLRDTPLHTAIYHPAEETLALWK